MDELLQKAKERREQLRRELESIDNFIHDYTVNVARARPVSQPDPDLFDEVRFARTLRRQAVAAMMDDAEAHILEAGRPLTRFQILDHLIRKGYDVEGGDAAKVLGTNLWRSKRFHNIRGFGYWPRAVEIPPAYKRFALRETSLS